jgi:hypothetical protein
MLVSVGRRAITLSVGKLARGGHVARESAITFDCLIVFISPLYAASGFGCAGVGGCSSSLEAASSQTWASCLRDTRTSSSCIHAPT